MKEDQNSGVYECLLLAMLMLGMGFVIMMEHLSYWMGHNDWILRWLLVVSVCGLIVYIALAGHGHVDSNGNLIHWQRPQSDLWRMN